MAIPPLPPLDGQDPAGLWQRFCSLLWHDAELGLWLDISRMAIAQADLEALEPRFAPAFAAPPVVLATPIDSSNDDNLLTIRNVTAASFQVRTRDVVDLAAKGGNAPVPQDTAFTFVAFGAA